MSPFVVVPGRAGLDGHECAPPTRWPWLRRGAHPTGTVWRCDATIARQTNVVGDIQRVECGKRWRLEWTHRVPTVPRPDGAWTPDGHAERAYPLWAEVHARKPDTPPPGPSGVSPSRDGRR